MHACAGPRWALAAPPSTSREQDTPRNLMGFKDGTRNILADETDALREHVWVGDEGDWLAGGSYLVARRINMTIESWDRASLADQGGHVRPTQVTGALDRQATNSTRSISRRATRTAPR